MFSFTYLSFTGSGMLIAAIISGFLMGFSPGKIVSRIRPDHQGLRLFADHDLGDAGDRHPDAAFRRRRDARSRLRRDRRALSVLRHPARLAGRGADRIGYRVEHAVRQPAEDHSRATRPVADSDGRGQFLGRRDGQDDRRPVDRRRLDRDQLVRHEGTILRFVFKHSIALACLVGILVMLQAYVYPFSEMVLK